MSSYTLRLVPINYSSPDLFSLSCTSSRDIVGKPLISDGSVPAFRFESAVSKVSLPSVRFRRARVTISWPSATHTVEWDQAGLLLVRPHRDLPEPTASNAGDHLTTPSFVKIGLEVVRGKLTCAVSSFENGGRAEWSLWPLSKTFWNTHGATFEIVKHGPLLVCFLVEEEVEVIRKSLMRTVSWCFDDVGVDEPDIWVGFYVSRPI
ncbi:uncharacterized protein Z519_05385 [Cladophialophora bantiana CBS 173.52]|uniref:Uncharacterized protein n=1 Tax=Cladophialophora bantiana (strain ATCC 10958 / CBS 173.52 / CDC B-1940 / NIH 8579) TaxID=1442370 RepID=A0A0D2IB79_CLAB1|nr:uncharacterized protein Z519_05385 [Cladophialophora bantiana CBS 173.52]KIW94069.1 hypothetical protein Z519_05385 [Cladophialophora bantiana CBS 173.52]